LSGNRSDRSFDSATSVDDESLSNPFAADAGTDIRGEAKRETETA